MKKSELKALIQEVINEFGGSSVSPSKALSGNLKEYVVQCWAMKEWQEDSNPDHTQVVKATDIKSARRKTADLPYEVIVVTPR